jgi:hypothetical protein
MLKSKVKMTSISDNVDIQKILNLLLDDTFLIEIRNLTVEEKNLYEYLKNR